MFLKLIIDLSISIICFIYFLISFEEKLQSDQ